MKKILISFIAIFCSINSFAQIKFGARSGAGVYFDIFYLNILQPKDNFVLDGPKVSYFGNPIPRSNDINSHKVYADAGFSQEIFAKWKIKNEISFSYTYIKEPRAYQDLAEIFWGENEDHREIYYQLIYIRQIWDKKKFSFQIGSGIAINKFIVTRVVYDSFIDDNGDIMIGNIDYYSVGNSPGQYDLGFPLKTQLNYNINKNAAFGLQSNIIYLMGIGINHLTLTPTLQISF